MKSFQDKISFYSIFLLLWRKYSTIIRPCHKGSVIALTHTHALPNELQECNFSFTQLKLLRQITLAIFNLRKYFFKVQTVSSLTCSFCLHFTYGIQLYMQYTTLHMTYNFTYGSQLILFVVQCVRSFKKGGNSDEMKKTYTA